MTIPVPPDLTTDAADAYRAGYAAGVASGQPCRPLDRAIVRFLELGDVDRALALLEQRKATGLEYRGG